MVDTKGQAQCGHAARASSPWTRPRGSVAAARGARRCPARTPLAFVACLRAASSNNGEHRSEPAVKELEKTPDDYDYFTLHQANHYILKQLSRKIKIPMEKIPISLDRFGNNSSNSVPLVLADHFSNIEPKKLKLFMSGFGAGLSWACADLEFDSSVILPIIYTDAYHKLN